MDLGVYVSTLNEDVLIEACLKNIIKVFPTVRVIDLGSTDRTVDIVEGLGVPINHHPLQPMKTPLDGPAQEWIRLKNEYAAKHDWILIIDGDEIFDEENLLKLKGLFEEASQDTWKSYKSPRCAGRGGPYTAYHIGWKMVRETGEGYQVSNMIPSGTKLYKSSAYTFYRGWPTEILKTNDVFREHSHKQPKDETTAWCWHGVLLNRSSMPEATGRMKKRQERTMYYNDQLQWEDIEKWPWT